MSDEDKDVDIDTDADKRAHHNALERKRRDHIKDSFTSLRDSVPSLHGEKVKPYKASRAQILKKAAEYIQLMRRKNSAHQQDIDDIKKQNKILEEQTLEKAKAAGLANYSGTSILDNKSKSESISSFDGISDSESSEGDGAATNGSSGSLSALGQHAFGPPNKKVKVTSNNTTDSSNAAMNPTMASFV
ncbi:protein max-like isoform X1 [Dinothrombium tinctorium]|uniref:Protein max n=1 Tax=Dinothrombium tinctorium TaxID=1965070 RepID=A0A443QCP8_9ACAR|nr:protein max-like isoform X1 [Dinothrombium tinctorium]